MINKDIRKYLQSIAMHTRKKYSQELRQMGLHIGQELALYFLWKQDGITQSELREKTGTQASTMSNMLRKLESDGIIYRKTAQEDSRVTKVYLTEKGHKLRQPVEKMWKNHERSLLEGLLPEERLLLRRFLQQMDENIKGSID